MEAETPGVGDEVRPYKIRVSAPRCTVVRKQLWLTCAITIQVSSKYLDLTRQKLELTRLPHEGSAPNSADWWEPKPQVEPLIDYW